MFVLGTKVNGGAYLRAEVSSLDTPDTLDSPATLRVEGSPNLTEAL